MAEKAKKNTKNMIREVAAGDTVKVWQKIEEKGKTRLQAFEGVVLARKHGNEAGATFTVRKVVDGIGVEKIFPIASPRIDRVEILRSAKVRRAKLYFIREKAAREVRKRMGNLRRQAVLDSAEPTDVSAEAAPAAEEKVEA